MYTTCSELVIFMYWTCKSINNLFSYCGLVDARIRASNKDLPALLKFCLIDMIIDRSCFCDFFQRNFLCTGTLCILNKERKLKIQHANQTPCYSWLDRRNLGSWGAGDNCPSRFWPNLFHQKTFFGWCTLQILR